MSFKIWIETSARLLREFQPEAFPGGAAGARWAAARLARQEGGRRGIIMTGPEDFLARRYAPEYARGRFPYRVPCSVPGCREWLPPGPPGRAPVCGQHRPAAGPRSGGDVRTRPARRAGGPSPRGRGAAGAGRSPGHTAG